MEIILKLIEWIPGKILHNSIDRIIINPGSIKDEIRATGSMYSATSRGTTIGSLDENGNVIKSALDSSVYFTGEQMISPDKKNPDRLTRLLKNKEGKYYQKVLWREEYVKMLKANNICKDKSLDHESFNELLHWLDTFRMPLDELDNLIVRYHSSTHYETVCKHTFFHYNILILYKKKTENFGFQYCFQNFRPSTVNAANDSTASLPMRRSPPPTPTEPNKRQRTQETPSTTLSQKQPNFSKRLTLTISEHEKVRIPH